MAVNWNEAAEASNSISGDVVEVLDAFGRNVGHRSGAVVQSATGTGPAPAKMDNTWLYVGGAIALVLLLRRS